MPDPDKLPCVRGKHLRMKFALVYKTHMALRYSVELFASRPEAEERMAEVLRKRATTAVIYRHAHVADCSYINLEQGLFSCSGKPSRDEEPET